MNHSERCKKGRLTRYKRQAEKKGKTYADYLKEENEKAIKKGEMTEREAKEDYNRNIKLSKNQQYGYLQKGDGRVNSAG